MWISYCPIIDIEETKGVRIPNEPPIIVKKFREGWT